MDIYFADVTLNALQKVFRQNVPRKTLKIRVHTQLFSSEQTNTCTHITQCANVSITYIYWPPSILRTTNEREGYIGGGRLSIESDLCMHIMHYNLVLPFKRDWLPRQSLYQDSDHSHFSFFFS